MSRTILDREADDRSILIAKESHCDVATVARQNDVLTRHIVSLQQSEFRAKNPPLVIEAATVFTSLTPGQTLHRRAGRAVERQCRTRPRGN